MKESYTERIDIKRILWHIAVGISLSFVISMAVAFFENDYHYMVPVLLLFMEISLIIVGIRFVFGRYVVFEEKVCYPTKDMEYAQKIEWDEDMKKEKI